MKKKPVVGEPLLDLLPPKKKGPKKWSVFSIRIDADLAEALSEIAREAGYTRNEVIGRFLQYARIAHESRKVPAMSNGNGGKGGKGDED